MATAEQKGKKPRIDDEDAEHIDGALLHSIEKLQEVQDEIERVNEEASDKVMEVEQNYDEIRRPVYARRNEIIKQIPDFWLTAFLSHPGDLLTEDDQKVFKHLVSIDVDESKDGYSITLAFSSNPYFEDTKLTKMYSFSDDGTITINTTSINWKDGMDIVNGKAYTKDGHKRLLIDESFFTWFSDAKNGTFAPGERDKVADIIREDLWPNPLKFFNNEAEDEFEGEEEDEEGSDDDDDDDEDQDEE